MISRILNISEIIGNNGSAFLFGARGTGKTVLAKKWLETEHNPFSIDLLDPEFYQRYLRKPKQLILDIEGALKKRDKPLSIFIDEIQKIPPLLQIVHKLYTDHHMNNQFPNTCF